MAHEKGRALNLFSTEVSASDDSKHPQASGLSAQRSALTNRNTAASSPHGCLPAQRERATRPLRRLYALRLLRPLRAPFQPPRSNMYTAAAARARSSARAAAQAKRGFTPSCPLSRRALPLRLSRRNARISARSAPAHSPIVSRTLCTP